jgi:hypothetical protein
VVQNLKKNVAVKKAAAEKQLGRDVDSYFELMDSVASEAKREAEVDKALVDEFYIGLKDILDAEEAQEAEAKKAAVLEEAAAKKLSTLDADESVNRRLILRNVLEVDDEQSRILAENKSFMKRFEDLIRKYFKKPSANWQDIKAWLYSTSDEIKRSIDKLIVEARTFYKTQKAKLFPKPSVAAPVVQFKALNDGYSRAESPEEDNNLDEALDNTKKPKFAIQSKPNATLSPLVPFLPAPPAGQTRVLVRQTNDSNDFPEDPVFKYLVDNADSFNKPKINRAAVNQSSSQFEKALAARAASARAASARAAVMVPLARNRSLSQAPVKNQAQVQRSQSFAAKR